MDLLDITNVTVEYKLDDYSVTALDGISLTVPDTKYSIGVIGESGSGKTTLGMSIMRAIERPGEIVSGDIRYQGESILGINEKELRRYRWEQVAMVYQSAMNSLNPVKKSVDHISEVLREHRKIGRRDANERAMKLLASMGLRDIQAESYPHELSGGMRQRVVIAMALALSPKLLIADEPTSALDVVTQKQILSLLKSEISKSDQSLIFITHEISLLGGLVEDIIVMYSGEIFEKGPTDKVLYEPLHPYTEMLLSTLLTLESKLPPTSPQKIINTNPSSANYCKFVSRCKYAFERCEKEKPKLSEVSQGRWVACHKFP